MLRSDDVDHHQSYVILLGGRERLPVSDLGHETIGDLDRGVCAGAAEDLFQTSVSESDAGRVLGLDDTIRVEKEPVAGIQGDAGDGVFSVRENPEEKAVAL